MLCFVLGKFWKESKMSIVYVGKGDSSPGGGGGGTPLYGLYRYVRPQRVWFSTVSVINRASILANFGHFGNK